jgi:hypothetical protein
LKNKQKGLPDVANDVTMTWQKWGSKQALEKRKSSLSLMEVLTLH